MYPNKLVLPALLFLLPVTAFGQSFLHNTEGGDLETEVRQSLTSLLVRQNLNQNLRPTLNQNLNGRQDTVTTGTTEAPRQVFPDPETVLYKSLMIPGWGQVVNRQAWKIPLIYGVFGGLGYVTHTLTKRYHDYRAAYYNRTREGESDLRFGTTPSWIPENVNLRELRDARNNARNQRDTMFIIFGLAYGLNALDAYVYAHMRSFDVSDDLSASAVVGPAALEGTSPGLSVRVNLLKKR